MTNPLLEADPTSISELFSTDPLKLTNKDIDQIVERLRADRVLWEKAENEKPKGQGKKKTVDDLASLNLELDLSGLST